MLLAANSTPLRSSLARAAGRPVLDGVGGIRLEQFHPAPGRRPAGAIRVLLNGRRSRKKKGTDLILRALARLPRDLPPLEVILFDSIEPHNRQDPRPGAPLPTGHPIVGARFVMNPSQAELAELYQSAHVFVAAERKAGWCNTALEAMACGAAVVCTRSGTTDFARHGRNALVTWRHPFFIRRAVLRLLRDRALRERLGEEAARDARPWAWDRLAAKLLAQVAVAKPAD
jgi:glycosyltransferase involved in cell wall biosynthesis